MICRLICEICYFVPSPLPEYTISGSYNSDRLRGARPMDSPRWLAVAKSVWGIMKTSFKRNWPLDSHREAEAFVHLSKEISVFSSRYAENLANEQKNGTPW